ncbi:MAG: FG-GAP-like repeat-containing protein [Bacteroidota bacterium]
MLALSICLICPYFTFGQSGPGGVNTDLLLWVRADSSLYSDAGSTAANPADNIQEWHDKSASGNHLYSTGSNRPVWDWTNMINYQPVVNMDGIDDLLYRSDIFGGSNSEINVFIVAQWDVLNDNAGLKFTTSELAVKRYLAHFPWNNGNFYWDVGANFGSYRVFSSSIDTQGPFLVGLENSVSNGHQSIRLKGAVSKSDLDGHTVTTDTLLIGADYNGNGDYLNASIAEIIIYDADLSTTDKEKVETYLALKYGIHIAHDFVASDGTLIWDASVMSTYHNDISGIGRDDDAGLHQKQSGQNNNEDILSIGMGSIAASNASNSSTITIDKTFFMWGNDNDDGNGIIEETTVDRPANVGKRLDREWKILEMGELGVMDLSFDLSSLNISGTSVSDFKLLVDTDGDGDFTDGGVTQIDPSSYASGVLIFDDIDLDNGDVITLKTDVPTIDLSIELMQSTCQEALAVYNIFLINNDGVEATGLTVSATLPSGFTFYGDSIALGGLATFDSTSLPTYGSTGVISWSNFGIPDQDTIVLNFSALVNSGTADGNYTLNASGGGPAQYSPSLLSGVTAVGGANCVFIPEFTCEPAFYQTYKKKNGAPKFAKLKPADGSYEEISVIDAMVNGMGYDVNTGIAYGSCQSRFVSLSEDGVIRDLGLPLAKNSFCGDMDFNGFWYGKVGGDMVKIDVSGPTIVATYSGQGIAGWDMAYNTDGNFYAVHKRTLYKFDTGTNTKSTIGSIIGATIPNSGYGAQWTGTDGYLYISNNSTGQIYQINVTTREAKLVMTSTSGLKLNDGFSCPQDIPVVFDYDYGDNIGLPQARSLAFRQEIVKDNVPDYEAFWLGAQVAADTVALANSDASTDTYDDGLTIPSAYVAGSTIAVDINLNTNMSNKRVYYGLWVDWDGDFSFDDFYNGSRTISSATTETVNVSIPSEFGDGTASWRVRVAEKELVLADGSGDLGLGETEDYVSSFTVSYPVCNTFSRSSGTGLESESENTWGASWVDYDDDGDDDLFVADYAHWQASRMYQNNGFGIFYSVDIGQATTHTGSNAGPVWGDYDNDGDIDFYMANNIRAYNHLYENIAGTFDLADTTVQGYEGYSHSASFVDYDNDGYLDIFATDLFETRFNQLFHNDQDGTFSTATGAPINREVSPTLNGVWGDYDNDGLLDLFVANMWGNNNTLYHNDGNGKFTVASTGLISADGGNSQSGSWVDFDNDRDLDLFVSNASDQEDFLYVNDGDGTFTKNTSSIISTEAGHTMGSVWGDFDNDGDQDLYVVHDNGNTNSLFYNYGSGGFNKVITSDPATDTENSVSPMISDFDNDGDIDIFVTNRNGETNVLYVNDAASCGNAWVCINLTGNASNKSAVGARLELKANIDGVDTWQTRVITTRSGGISAQSSMKAHFGLGDASSVDSLVIFWPSGNKQVITSLTINQCNDISETQPSTVTFHAFIDANGNCNYDAGEKMLPDVSGVISGIGYRIATHENGTFTATVGVGSYTFTEDADARYTHTCYTTRAFSTTSGQNTDVYLPHEEVCSDPDLWVELASTAKRRALRNKYQIAYGNTGSSDATTVEIAVDFDDYLIPLSANPAWSRTEAGNVYVWEFASIDAFSSGMINVVDSVSSAAFLGYNTTTSASFNGVSADCDLSDNTDTNQEIVVGPIDPNDLIVMPKRDIRRGEELIYRIRFQNVGTYLAENVYLVDTLSQYLDPESMSILGASHYYEMEWLNDQVVKFNFEYIMLPDSGINEPESHGYVEFKILPHKFTPSGSVIENQAAITFDREQPLLTNITSNRLLDVLVMEEEEDEEEEQDDSLRVPDLGLQLQQGPLVSVYPNPGEGQLSLKLIHLEEKTYQIQITNDIGMRIYNKKIRAFRDNLTLPFDAENWSAGIYKVMLSSDDTVSSFKFVVK